MTLVDVDEDDDDPLCTLIVSLIQVWPYSFAPFPQTYKRTSGAPVTRVWCYVFIGSPFEPKLPTWILVHCETFWFTLKLHELCIIEGKTRTQTRRCWESVNRWVENCSNSVKLCRSWLSNMFAEFGSKTDLQDLPRHYIVFLRVCDLPCERSITFGRGQTGRWVLQIHAQVELTKKQT